MEFKAQDTEDVAFAARVAAVEGQVTVKPIVGLTTELKATVPEKSKVLVRLTDNAGPVAPKLKLTGVPAEILNSPMCTTEDAG